jgi:hypothetical protein
MEQPISFSLNYVLKNLENKVLSNGEAKAILDKRVLTVNHQGKIIVSIPYFQILDINDEDYSITLYLYSGEKLVLNQIGYEYENFLRKLYKLRNELLLKYMLMEEQNIAYAIEANYKYFDEDGDERKGPCEARVYESALVILPDKGEPIRIPLCYIYDTTLEDYTCTIKIERGQWIKLSQMGEKTDYFKRSLDKSLDDLNLRACKLLSELAPGIDHLIILKASILLSDGKAASKTQIQTISPELWIQLEKRLKLMGLDEEYRYLTNLSAQTEVWIGVKRGLMGEKSGEYFWFMTPIYDSDPNKPGNALAVEAASEENFGKATYFFRIFDRDYYRKGNQHETLRTEIEKFVDKINQSMIEINFRREPIYLIEDKLNTPEYEMYLYASNKLSSLKHLRRLYLGRVLHISFEQWKTSVDDLLTFNTQSIDNEGKWKKG